jgi:hypothetical protein
MMGAPIDGSSVRIKPSAEGGAPQGVREQNYLRPPVDFLRVWHMKVEAWVLEQAGLVVAPELAALRVVAS